jgi:hypothetical protein
VNALDNYADRRIAALCWKDPNADSALLFRSATSNKYTLVSDIARVRSYPTINLLNVVFSATEKKGGVAGASDWDGLEVSDESPAGKSHSCWRVITVLSCNADLFLLMSLCIVKEELVSYGDHLNVINLELPSPASVGLSFARLKKAVSELAFTIPNDRENWIPVCVVCACAPLLHCQNALSPRPHWHR